LSDPTASRLQSIQTALGVAADGVLGPETLSALEQRLEIVPAAADASLTCSISSLEQIVEFEVTSQAHYEEDLEHPVWPGGQSGVTIGIGYDIGVTSRKEIEADWLGEIADADLKALLVAQGVTGPSAKTLARGLAQVTVPYDVAEAVFFRRTLPRYAQRTAATYPGAEVLPADAQGMLLSLIYNRGSKLVGPTRTEMAAIKPLVAVGTSALGDIAGQVELMTRLWPDVPGLQDRRRREARIIRAANRTYQPAELVRL
jgi:hypothetical protein